MELYNVFYHTSKGWKKYCVCDMSLEKAKEVALKFCNRYIENGRPKAYPNGKGYYDVSLPRIVKVS